MKSYILILLSLYVFVSCQNRLVTENELKEYVLEEDHKLIQKQERAGIDLSVSYRPTDLLAAQELRTKKDVSIAGVDSVRSKYRNYAYFVLNLSKGNKEVLKQMSNFGSFSNTLQTLSFDMANKVNLTTSNQDTIPVADFIYPRLYGASQSTSLLFALINKKLRQASIKKNESFLKKKSQKMFTSMQFLHDG